MQQPATYSIPSIWAESSIPPVKPITRIGEHTPSVYLSVCLSVLTQWRTPSCSWFTNSVYLSENPLSGLPRGHPSDFFISSPTLPTFLQEWTPSKHKFNTSSTAYVLKSPPYALHLQKPSLHAPGRDSPILRSSPVAPINLTPSYR
jgi:hypothetical protein